MRETISTSLHVSFTDWFSSTFDSLDVDLRRSVAMLCWSIWKCKNELVWNQRSLEMVEVVASSRVALNQWQEWPLINGNMLKTKHSIIFVVT